MSQDDRSELACPVCFNHTLALDEPPRIDVMGVQVYSDIVGMGDLHNQGALGIVCLTCDTHWRDKDAFDRGEPDPPAQDEGDEAEAEALLADADADAADPVEGPGPGDDVRD